MSQEEKFSLDDFLKKVQNGDVTLLVVGAVLMLVPIVAIFFLTMNPEGQKKMSQEKMRNIVSRKNVFNFGTKNESGKAFSSPRSGSSSSSSWFSSRTPEQQVTDELEDARKAIERGMFEAKHRIDIEDPDSRLAYLAENNYNLCMANGAIERGLYKQAEEYLMKALEDDEENVFLQAYALGSLCALYEHTGDRRKLEEAYKRYIEAVAKLPPEFGGCDLRPMVRNLFQSLQAISKSADVGKVNSVILNDPVIRSGKVPTNLEVNNVYKDFPIKYQ